MKKKLFNFFGCICVALCCKGQTSGYKYSSLLDSVTTSGFYNISLIPEITAHLKPDHSDIRIVNETGKWVPHILRFPAGEVGIADIAWDLKFTQVEDYNKNTVVIIETSTNTISNINLVLKNTSAERFCTLSGSDDAKDWFIINDSILIDPTTEADKTTNTFQLSFPSVNYKFLKVVIHNSNKDPFDIKGVTWSTAAFTTDFPKGKIYENPLPKTEQKDSNKISYIKITQQGPYHFDDINLKISGAKYFHRNVGLYIPSSNVHSFADPGTLLESFTISNNSTLQYQIPLINAAVFYLLIHNEDSPPITVDEVRTTSKYRCLTAYLEKGKSYKLIMDNPSAISPNYDLAHLRNFDRDSISTLNTGKIIAFQTTQPSTATSKNYKWLLWSSIGAALLILLFLTKKNAKGNR